MTTPEPWRRFLAEFVGTALLVTAVVGSGIMASRLSPYDVGLQLLECSTTVALALGALILMLGPVSGAHFNPVVSVADWFLGRRTHTGLTRAELTGYVVAQVAGAVAGSVLANLMFGLSAVQMSTKERSAGNVWLGEVVATAGLILLVFALVRAGRAAAMPAAVGAYIGAACWFTSSTSFANPAVTIGRAFTDTSAGIAATSVSGFIGAQLIGMALGVALLRALYPEVGRTLGDAAVDPVRGRKDRTDRRGGDGTYLPGEHEGRSSRIGQVAVHEWGRGAVLRQFGGHPALLRRGQLRGRTSWNSAPPWSASEPTLLGLGLTTAQPEM